MMTVFCPSGTSRVTPASTLLGPKDFVRSSSWIMSGMTERTACGPSSRSSQQDQRPEGIQHENGLAAEHHRAGRAFADALGAALRVQPAQTTHERHGGAEAGALDQAEPDVLEP